VCPRWEWLREQAGQNVGGALYFRCASAAAGLTVRVGAARAAAGCRRGRSGRRPRCAPALTSMWRPCWTLSGGRQAWLSAAQHSTAQHSATQHSTAQHIAAQHSTAQHSTAQHSTSQHSTAQHRLSTALVRRSSVSVSTCTCIGGAAAAPAGVSMLWSMGALPDASQLLAAPSIRSTSPCAGWSCAQ
jgi:adenine-specific DNA-methyltransferase